MKKPKPGTTVYEAGPDHHVWEWLFLEEFMTGGETKWSVSGHRIPREVLNQETIRRCYPDRESAIRRCLKALQRNRTRLQKAIAEVDAEISDLQGELDKTEKA